MLFRLILNGESSSILVRCDNHERLQLYLDDIGGIGNQLYEILSVLNNGYELVKIEGVESNPTDNDTIIAFNRYCYNDNI
jgi:hypothetical protein